MKHMLNVKKTTRKLRYMATLVAFPMSIDIKKRIIGF